MKHKTLLLFAVGAVGAGAYWYRSANAVVAPQVRTAAVSRGAVTQVVQAVGTLQPVTTVTVGSQVSGVIAWLGADFNAVIHKGDVLAKLDPSLLQAERDQAAASLAKVQADVEQRAMDLTDSQTKEQRAKALAGQGLLSASDLESATLAVHAANTALASAKAQVVQAQASLHQSQVNLDHSTITSPIDGIVISRSVDVGQTVAASLSSPTIFLLAGDLTEMRVMASVDEGDISRVSEGQAVQVKVDAYPNQTFAGVVSQIRLQPVITSNVTTYPAIIDVDNGQSKLKPGMTANVSITLASRSDVLRVPNTALRFTPSAAIFAALNQPIPAPSQGQVAAARPSIVGGQDRPMGPQVVPVVYTSGPVSDGGATTETRNGTGRRASVWVQTDGQLREIAVTVGLADAINTELVSGDLQPGDAVVTSVLTAGDLARTVSVPRPASSSVFTGAQGPGRGTRP